jgi:hypothetical protein
MQYSSSYLDECFNSITDYHSKVELCTIAYHNLKDNPCDWIIELSEIMNWQAMSDRSGVWTYYDCLFGKSAHIVIRNLQRNNENEILEKYISGIGKCFDEAIMDEIGTWIKVNKEKIYNYLEDILITNKSWFYKL